MHFLRVCLTFHVFLIIVACNMQEKVSSVENKAEIISTPTQSYDIVNTVPQKDPPALNLSIDSLIDKGKTNDDRSFINNNVHTEENSALFNTLNKKHAESEFNISGELLTDKNADDEVGFIKSVDGIQIDIRGNFK